MQVSLTLNDILPQTTRDLLLSRYKTLKEPSETLNFLLDYNDILSTTLSDKIACERARAEKHFNTHITYCVLFIVFIMAALVGAGFTEFASGAATCFAVALEFVPAAIMLALMFCYGERYRSRMEHVEYLEQIAAVLPRKAEQ